MKKKIFSGFYRKLISAIKKLDGITNYKIGDIARRITDINTRKKWDKKLASHGATWRDFPYNYILEFLPQDKEFSLLDIGCALGEGCLLLKKHFPKAQISGADLSTVGIEEAKKKTDEIEFFILDIAKENPPKKYDYITLIHTLEHFNDPFPIVNKCLRFVNEALIIQVPYTEKFDSPRLYWRGWHRYLFNKDTFSKYNYKILKITEYIESARYRYIIYRIIP